VDSISLNLNQLKAKSGMHSGEDANGPFILKRETSQEPFAIRDDVTYVNHDKRSNHSLESDVLSHQVALERKKSSNVVFDETNTRVTSATSTVTLVLDLSRSVGGAEQPVPGAGTVTVRIETKLRATKHQPVSCSCSKTVAEALEEAAPSTETQSLNEPNADDIVAQVWAPSSTSTLVSQGEQLLSKPSPDVIALAGVMQGEAAVELASTALAKFRHGDLTELALTRVLGTLAATRSNASYTLLLEAQSDRQLPSAVRRQAGVSLLRGPGDGMTPSWVLQSLSHTAWVDKHDDALLLLGALCDGHPDAQEHVNAIASLLGEESARTPALLLAAGNAGRSATHLHTLLHDATLSRVPVNRLAAAHAIAAMEGSEWPLDVNEELALDAGRTSGTLLDEPVVVAGNHDVYITAATRLNERGGEVKNDMSLTASALGWSFPLGAVSTAVAEATPSDVATSSSASYLGKYLAVPRLAATRSHPATDCNADNAPSQLPSAPGAASSRNWYKATLAVWAAPLVSLKFELAGGVSWEVQSGLISCPTTLSAVTAHADLVATVSLASASASGWLHARAREDVWTGAVESQIVWSDKVCGKLSLAPQVLRGAAAMAFDGAAPSWSSVWRTKAANNDTLVGICRAVGEEDSETNDLILALDVEPMDEEDMAETVDDDHHRTRHVVEDEAQRTRGSARWTSEHDDDVIDNNEERTVEAVDDTDDGLAHDVAHAGQTARGQLRASGRKSAHQVSAAERESKRDARRQERRAEHQQATTTHAARRGDGRLARAINGAKAWQRMHDVAQAQRRGAHQLWRRQKRLIKQFRHKAARQMLRRVGRRMTRRTRGVHSLLHREHEERKTRRSFQRLRAEERRHQHAKATARREAAFMRGVRRRAKRERMLRRRQRSARHTVKAHAREERFRARLRRVSKSVDHAARGRRGIARNMQAVRKGLAAGAAAEVRQTRRGAQAVRRANRRHDNRRSARNGARAVRHSLRHAARAGRGRHALHHLSGEIDRDLAESRRGGRRSVHRDARLDQRDNARDRRSSAAHQLAHTQRRTGRSVGQVTDRGSHRNLASDRARVAQKSRVAGNARANARLIAAQRAARRNARINAAAFRRVSLRGKRAAKRAAQRAAKLARRTFRRGQRAVGRAEKREDRSVSQYGRQLESHQKHETEEGRSDERKWMSKDAAIERKSARDKRKTAREERRIGRTSQHARNMANRQTSRSSARASRLAGQMDDVKKELEAESKAGDEYEKGREKRASGLQGDANTAYTSTSGSVGPAGPSGAVSAPMPLPPNGVAQETSKDLGRETAVNAERIDVPSQVLVPEDTSQGQVIGDDNAGPLGPSNNLDMGDEQTREMEETEQPGDIEDLLEQVELTGSPF